MNREENENMMHQIGSTADQVTISGRRTRAWLRVISGQLVTAECLCRRK